MRSSRARTLGHVSFVFLLLRAHRRARRCRKCEINASSNFAGRTMRFIHEFMDSRNKTDGITEECIIYASSSAFAAASLSCCQCHAALSPFPAHVSRRPIFRPPPFDRVLRSKRIISNFKATMPMYNSKLIPPELKFNFTNPGNRILLRPWNPIYPNRDDLGTISHFRE